VTIELASSRDLTQPASSTRRTIASQPFGVRGAFLWVSGSPPSGGLATSEFPVRPEWTTS
jgi:hypothetical protein